jgi:hypothetical protein
MTGLDFRRVGKAYRSPLDDGDALWLRRENGRWRLLWEHRTSRGYRTYTRLGTHPTLAAGKEYAHSLYPKAED